MKKHLLYIFLFCFATNFLVAQQLPYYTQFRSNEFITNPGVTGTKRLLDARVNYRTQWVGYDGAPQTTSVGIHSRFMKGTMGAGLYFMQDKIGPSKQSNIGVSYAYHLRFPDTELSAGVAANFTKYSLIGTDITIHNTQDPSINQFITNSTWVGDAAAGIYLYNDRFHVGASAMHVFQSTAEFYKADTTKKGLIRYATQANVTLGYNFSQNKDFIWESTLFASYVKGAPMNLDYTLRLHYKETVFVGVSVRLHDAIAFHIGYTFFGSYQVSYSYDFLINGLRSYSSGSHEIMIAVSHNIFTQKRGRVNDKFLHQKYGYLF
ncbi:MAG: PorP/SprF family type IX secretion system membrane protein [Bacteroidia bacterium]